jgi:hypothetical protein
MNQVSVNYFISNICSPFILGDEKPCIIRSFHSSALLKKSTPPVRNAYIPPWLVLNPKGTNLVWAATVRWAESGGGTMRVETTFLWMSDL